MQLLDVSCVKSRGCGDRSIWYTNGLGSCKAPKSYLFLLFL